MGRGRLDCRGKKIERVLIQMKHLFYIGNDDFHCDTTILSETRISEKDIE